MRRTVVVLLVALAVGVSACSGSPKAPYVDKRSVGAIALYGEDGKPVSGGKVSDKPFVWKAVALSAAPGGYAAAGRKATLVAIQPRQNVDPEQWDGTFLTSARTYTDPSRPTVAATAQDSSLADFLAAYPPQWNGYVQLRIYLGAPGHPTLNTSYASADIKIDGDKWTLVRGVPSGALGAAPVAVGFFAVGPPVGARPQRVKATQGVTITVSVPGKPKPSPTPKGGPLPRTGDAIALVAAAGLVLLGAGLVLRYLASRFGRSVR